MVLAHFLELDFCSEHWKHQAGTDSQDCEDGNHLPKKKNSLKKEQGIDELSVISISTISKIFLSVSSFLSIVIKCSWDFICSCAPRGKSKAKQKAFLLSGVIRLEAFVSWSRTIFSSCTLPNTTFHKFENTKIEWLIFIQETTKMQKPFSH